MLALFLISGVSIAQDEILQEEDRPVKSIFGSALLIDNHSVVVPIKGTFEFDIQHRFGSFDNGFKDFIGLYAPSNIRLGLSYAPINNLMVGVGFTKLNNYVDFWAKYAILQQTESGRMPVSLTYFGTMAIDTYDPDHQSEIYNSSDRLSYFHQLILARKFSNWLSIQVAPSWTHFNIVDKGYKNDHFAIAVGGRIGIYNTYAIIFNYDQPLTKHDPPNNPSPNLSIGVEVSTSSHAFQIFIGNYRGIIPQENNLYNMNNYQDGFTENFSLGFNITRLWNF